MIITECFKIIMYELNGFYNKALGGNQLKTIQRHGENTKIMKQFKNQYDIDFPQLIIDMQKNPMSSTFHEKLIVKNFGFKDQMDYYEKASSHHVIPDIKIPTLFFSALNDPLIGEMGIDWKSVAENPNTVLVTTEEGGHTSHHYSILNMHKQFWIDASLDYFEAFNI
jgi:predicted alpha/beta-fold hydrolase